MEDTKTEAVETTEDSQIMETSEISGSAETVETSEPAEVVEATGSAETVETSEPAEVVEAAEPEKSTNYPTQVVLTIRTIVGAYVVYLAYQIMTSGNEITIPMWAAVVLFIVAGSGLVIMSVKHFICGEYEGGKKDV